MTKKVLIVDDAAFMRKVLGDITRKMGFEVVGEGADGQEGIELFKKLSPDLVTLDIVMPEVDGLEALSTILRHDSRANVIMVSALAQQALVMEAINIGAKDFIVKPFKEEKVIEVVKNVMSI